MDTRTLPGWPDAPDVTALDAILLLIVPAIAVFVVFSVIGHVGHRIHLNRGGNTYDEDEATREGRERGALDEPGSGGRAALSAQQSEPSWMVEEEPGDELAGVDETEAARLAHARRGEAPVDHPGGDDQVGGARARW